MTRHSFTCNAANLDSTSLDHVMHRSYPAANTILDTFGQHCIMSKSYPLLPEKSYHIAFQVFHCSGYIALMFIIIEKLGFVFLGLELCFFIPANFALQIAALALLLVE